MKQIPSPQLIRIPHPEEPSLSLVSIKPAETRSDDIWEDFLRIQIKQTTHDTYRRAILRFCQDVAPAQSPSDFVAEFLSLPQKRAIQLTLEWRQSQIASGLAASTINQRLAAIKSLVTYATKAEMCGYSLSSIKSLKDNGYRDTRGVSVDDYRSILAQVDRTTDLGIRDYAILRLLWDLALRRGEIVSLDLHHYSHGKVMVLGKGKIDRQALSIGPGLAEALDDWVNVRKGMYFQPKKGSQSEALFLSCTGQRLDGVAIWRIVSNAANASGIKLSPHRVRHSSITAFLDASEGDLRSAQALSRHADPRTLMIYDDNRKGLQDKATQVLEDLVNHW